MAAQEPAVAKLDTAVADGGLAQCLEQCNVHADIRKLIADEGFESLTDFYRGFHGRHWETDIQDFHKKVTDPDLKEKRVSVARLKAAWVAAKEVCDFRAPKEDPKQSKSDKVEDWEAPLDEADYEEMDASFRKAYEVVIDTQLWPCDALQCRIFREFRKWAATVPEIGKMRSLLSDKAGKREEKHPFGPNVNITYSAIPDYVPHNVVEYYWGLRVNAVAWAKAGCYDVDSVEKPGVKVRMMPFDKSIDYADRALRIALATGLPPNEQLAWLERKDRTTRALMASYIRQKWPAQEALKQALAETNTDWTVVKNREVVGVHESMVAMDLGMQVQHRSGSAAASSAGAGAIAPWSRHRDDKGKGKGKGKDGKKGGSKQVISKIGQQASQSAKHGKFCGKFNSKAGCKSNEWYCSQKGRHRCAFIVSEDGRTCDATDHGFTGHRR